MYNAHIDRYYWANNFEPYGDQVLKGIEIASGNDFALWLELVTNCYQ